MPNYRRIYGENVDYFTVVTCRHYGGDKQSKRELCFCYDANGNRSQKIDGSTTITATENGTLASEQKYTAWGQTRSGSVGTDRQYTGQISEPQLGLYFYNARYYDGYLNRWLQPDTIIPSAANPQAWDRYAYVNNNPINFTDPSGHRACESRDGYECDP